MSYSDETPTPKKPPRPKLFDMYSGDGQESPESLGLPSGVQVFSIPKGMSPEEVVGLIKTALEGNANRSTPPAEDPPPSNWSKELSVAKSIVSQLTPHIDAAVKAAQKKMLAGILASSQKSNLRTEQIVLMAMSGGNAIFLEILRTLLPPPDVIISIARSNACNKSTLSAVLLPVMANAIITSTLPEEMQEKLRAPIDPYFK